MPRRRRAGAPTAAILAFLSGRGDDGRSRAALDPPASGGEAEKFTELKGGVEDFAWSPDGKRLVLVVGGSRSRMRLAEKDGAARSRRRRSRSSSTGSSSSSTESATSARAAQHLYLLDRDSRKVEHADVRVTTTSSVPAWSPDGKTIAFVSKQRARPRPHRQLGRLHDRAARRRRGPRKLTTFEGSDNDPDWGDSRLAWSPDSKLIAYVQGGRRQAHLLRPAAARRRAGGRRPGAGS